MFRFRTWQLALSTLFFTFLFACSSKSEFESIPDKTSLVAVVDFQKMALNALSFENLLKGIGQAGDTSKQSAEDMGVDFLRKGIVFLEDKEPGKRIYFIVPISNKEAFKKYVQQQVPGLSVMQVGGQEWLKKETFMLLLQDKTAFGVFVNGLADPKTAEEKIRKMAEGPDSQGLMASNPHFKAFSEKSFDAGMWLDMERITSESAAFAQLPTKPKGNLEMFLNFGNGEVNLSGNYLNGDSLSIKYAKSFSAPIDPQQLRRIPSEKPLMLMAFRGDFSAYYQVLAGMPEMQQGLSATQALGFEAKEVFDMLGDHCMLSMNSAPPTGEMIPKMSLLFTLKNPGKAQEILGKVSQTGMLMPTGPSSFVSPSLPMLGVYVQNDQLEISNLGMPSKGSFDPKNYTGQGKDVSYVLLDLQAILNLVPAMGENQEMLNLTKATFKSVEAGGQYVSERETEYRFSLKTMKPDENSLLTIGTYFNKMKEIEARKQKSMQDALDQASAVDTLGI